jgi:hypothetical protein
MSGLDVGRQLIQLRAQYRQTILDVNGLLGRFAVLPPWCVKAGSAPSKKARKSVIRTIDSARDLA